MTHNAALRRTWRGLAAARLWAALWPVWTVSGSYAATCLIFPSLLQNDAARGSLQFIVTALLLWVLARRPLRLPTWQEAARAAEQASRLPHRPIDTLLDRPVAGDASLWAHHKITALQKLSTLRAARITGDVPARDPYALRHATFLFLLIGVTMAGSAAPQRLALGLTPPHLSILDTGARETIDAWIEPPAYTRLKPTHLAATRGDIPLAGPDVVVPAGSVLKLRVGGPGRPPRLRFGGQRVALPGDTAAGYAGDLVLTRTGALRLRRDVRDLGAWAVHVRPDTRPTLALTAAAPTGQNTLRLSYTAKDDYGVVRMTGTIVPDDDSDGAAFSFDMTPPANGQGDASFTIDLSTYIRGDVAAHLTLVATDGAGNATATTAAPVSLPARAFKNALSQKLAALRLDLKTAPETRIAAAGQVADIAASPDLYGGDASTFLLLGSTARQLATPAASLDSARDLLWDIAVRLDADPLPDAARSLSAALQDLARALGTPDTPPADIAAKMDTARARLRAYVQTLATEIAQKMQAQGATRLPPDILRRYMQNLDLGEMLREMDRLDGAQGRDAMRAMAERLRAASESLGQGKMAQFQEEQARAFQALADLEKLAQAQEDLMSRPQKIPAQAAAQDALRARLGESVRTLSTQIKALPKDLATADAAMKAAADSLRAGKPNAARPQQAQAAESLRRGADGAARTLAASLRQILLSFGVSGGPSGAPGEGEDPLGRAPGDGTGKSGEGVLPTGRERLRAREIIDTLRQRANEVNRPRVEREYIDRLLDGGL